MNHIEHLGGSPARVGPIHGPAGVARRLLVDTLLALSGGAVLLLVASAVVSRAAGFDRSFMPAAAIVYGLVAVFVLAGLRHHPHPRFGLPNFVTTVRAVLTALFAGIVIDAGRLEQASLEPWAWAFAGLAILALVLDGLDGFLARRLSISSPFGARYDMEIDALLILLLSALAYGLEKAGVFVLAIGLMRYLFLAAQAFWPRLRGELPPSFRRKAVCVIQAGALGAMITPVVEPPLSSALAAVTVSLLAVSFLIDIVWLARRPRLVS